MIPTGRFVGLAEGIMDDTHVFFFLILQFLIRGHIHNVVLHKSNLTPPYLMSDIQSEWKLHESVGIC